VQYGTAFVFLFTVAAHRHDLILLRSASAAATNGNPAPCPIPPRPWKLPPLPPPASSTWPSAAPANRETAATLIEIENFDFYYGAKQALFDINLKHPERRVTAFIGPPAAASPRSCAASTG
jgi:hypothetical protein